MRTGIANLPLHYGHTPRWLFDKMKELARHICVAIVDEYGPVELLRRLSDPFWFQAFGCVLGFDWHSSGITTTVCGALKEGIRDIQYDIGFFVSGGKGVASRKTPSDIERYCYNLCMDPSSLIYASKMSAKVDNAALQDGYQLYHHTFFFTKNGQWAVVQQGMDSKNRYARRYHWLSMELEDFTNNPHKAICAQHTEEYVLNMVSEESRQARLVSTQISTGKPKKVLEDFEKIPRLNLPRRHYIEFSDINIQYLKKILDRISEVSPKDFESLLCIEGVGPKTIRALSLISEVIYGAKVSYKDPARFCYAHGGKDGHPYPVDRKTYNHSISILKLALHSSKIGHTDRAYALRRLYRYFNP